MTTLNLKRNIKLSVTSFTKVALLLVFCFLYTDFSYANNENISGVNCNNLPEETIEEAERQDRCFEYQDKKKSQAKEKKQVAYKESVRGKSEFNDVPYNKLSEDQKLIYPYRTLGSLEITYSVKQEDGRYKDIVAACGSYLDGEQTIRTDAHCIFNNELLAKAKHAEFILNDKLDIKSNKFIVDLKSLKIGYDNEKESNPWDWAQMKIDHPIGKKVGYFTINSGVPNGIKSGDKGTLPQPTGVQDPCGAIYNNAQDWDNPMNEVLNFYDEIFRESQVSYVVNAGLIEKDEYKICAAGFSDHSKFEISLTNCALGGVGIGRLLSNCSTKDGMSGGPAFYYNEYSDEYIAFGQISGGVIPDESEAYGDFGLHATTLSFLSSRIPDFYDINRGKYMASVQNPLNEDKRRIINRVFGN